MLPPGVGVGLDAPRSIPRLVHPGYPQDISRDELPRVYQGIHLPTVVCTAHTLGG